MTLRVLSVIVLALSIGVALVVCPTEPIMILWAAGNILWAGLNTAIAW